jgi:hypothetical protein
MPEVTDLMRVAQYVKSDKGAPSDVYNAACRMLNGPPPGTPLICSDERHQAEMDAARVHAARWQVELEEANGGLAELVRQVTTERDALKAVVESVWQYAEEMRTYCSPAGIAAVYADRLMALLPPRGAESNQDAQTGAYGTPETSEAPRDAQEAAQ